MNHGSPVQDMCPGNTCYGCGPSNPDGMHIKSYWSNDGKFLLAKYLPEKKYNAGFPNIMYGGTVASLIDCHSIWTAIAFACHAGGIEMQQPGTPAGITYMTGKLTVNYVKPTPLDREINLRAWISGETGRKVLVLCELGFENTVTATGEVLAIRAG